MKFKNPLLAVTDMAASIDFYKRVLGLRVVMDFGANVTLTGGVCLQTLETWRDFIGGRSVLLDGNAGINGGPAGDLYITFHIPEDSRFKRVGDDLYVTVPLNLYTAILGGEQIVETMDSKAKLKVKPGTQNNTKVRLRGKGFPVYKEEGKFGDMIVTYSIDIPTNLTDKQKELFREIQSLN